MDGLFSFRDSALYCHHSLDASPEPGDFPIHAHETPEVFYFISGSGEFLVEGARYALRPGDVLLMRPAETHKLLISPAEPYERVAVHFSERLFAALDRDRELLRAFYDRPLGQRNRYAADAYPRLRAAVGSFPLDRRPERLEILSWLLALLTELSLIHRAERGNAETADGFPARLVSYVNAHLFEEMSLQSVSAPFGKSASQTGRVFRQATGTSLWEYVTIKRLLAARAMLRRGDSAADASLACGFQDYSAFYRAYRKRFGHAPSAEPVTPAAERRSGG